jgi:importin-7
MVTTLSSRANLDLFSEVFEIIDSCTFSTRQISPTMWTFFPIMYKVFKDYAIDYIEGSPRVLADLRNRATTG